ncbi:unnamed protein product [Acanthoscelides obtectus]|uniref:Uncharacterized protein n=1 Tax=Acanthoscelides obtectus TaxID=200917 RepID=A0A9P0MKJ5_ACAOB|nr:unnamed protein product [Acanthoscelides obtectus]CAK1669577.1 hypothetical protein AOBTE_LOCUS27086 [Acanthoscelides obtectus]
MDAFMTSFMTFLFFTFLIASKLFTLLYLIMMSELLMIMMVSILMLRLRVLSLPFVVTVTMVSMSCDQNWNCVNRHNGAGVDHILPIGMTDSWSSHSDYRGVMVCMDSWSSMDSVHWGHHHRLADDVLPLDRDAKGSSVIIEKIQCQVSCQFCILVC